MISVAPVSAEFPRDSFYLALGVSKHRSIVCRLFHLVGGPRLRQAILEIIQIVGSHRTALASQHHESYGTIELWYFRLGKRARDFLGETKARDAAALAVALLYVVVDLDVPIPYGDVAGQAFQFLADLGWDKPFPIH